MSRLLRLSALLCVTGLTGCDPEPVSEHTTGPVSGYESESDLKAAVVAAFESGDAAELGRLTCWDRVPEARRMAVMSTYSRDVAAGIKDAKIVPTDQGAPDVPWQKDGVTYRSNLKVTMNLTINFATPITLKSGFRVSDVTYFLGQKAGQWYIAAPAPVVDE